MLPSVAKYDRMYRERGNCHVILAYRQNTGRGVIIRLLRKSCQRHLGSRNKDCLAISTLNPVAPRSDSIRVILLDKSMYYEQ